MNLHYSSNNRGYHLYCCSTQNTCIALYLGPDILLLDTTEIIGVSLGDVQYLLFFLAVPMGFPSELPMEMPWVSHGNTWIPWVTHGSVMGFPWETHWNLMGFPWATRGLPMGFSREAYGADCNLVGIPWDSNWSVMGIPWEKAGPVGSPREVHGLLMGSPWEHLSPMGNPWASHG